MSQHIWGQLLHAAGGMICNTVMVKTLLPDLVCTLQKDCTPPVPAHALPLRPACPSTSGAPILHAVYSIPCTTAVMDLPSTRKVRLAPMQKGVRVHSQPTLIHQAKPSTSVVRLAFIYSLDYSTVALVPPCDRSTIASRSEGLKEAANLQSSVSST